MADTIARELNEREQTESLAGLLNDLAAASAALVRDEIDLAKREFRDKIRTMTTGAAMIAAGGLVAVIGLMGLTAAAIIGLANYLAPGLSALIVGALLVLAGAAAAFLGMKRVKNTSLKPEQTIRTLKEDKDWLKAQMR
jgi:uncharacterized membrane protein YqjE